MSSDSSQKNHFVEQLDNAQFSMSILKWVWEHLNSKFSHLPTFSPSIQIFHVDFEVGVEAYQLQILTPTNVLAIHSKNRGKFGNAT
jgi:hypothetical protein